MAYSGFVGTSQWNFWHLHYFSQSPIRVTVIQQGAGDCDLYIKQNSDPTRIRYQYSDVSLNTEFSITIDRPGDDVWHLGVFGWTPCHYTISAEVIGKLCHLPL